MAEKKAPESRWTMLKNVRIAFANIHEAKPVGQTGAERYSCVLIIEPDSENDKTIMKEIAKSSKAKWADKSGAVLKTLATKDKICYMRRDFTDSEGNVYEGFEDHYALRVSNEKRPTIGDRHGKPLTKEDGRPYSGCYCNVWVNLWAQDNSYGQRINGTLGAVQFVNDAPGFGKGAPVSESVFEDLGVAEGEFAEAAIDPDAPAANDDDIDDDLKAFL